MSSHKNEQKSNSIVSYAVFFATLAVIIPSILSVLFPALIVSLTTEYPDKSVNPFELGALALPFLSVNVVLLGGVILLYYTGNLPLSIHRFIKFVFNFEISRRVSFLVILILITIYVVYSLEDFTKPDEWSDFSNIKLFLEGWPYVDKYNQLPFYYHVKNSLLYISENIFGNIRIVPFLGSISLLFLTYLVTAEITKKRFAGLVAMVILIQSSTFLRYDTIATYSNFWTLFYLLSLYLIIKKWQFSAFSYVLSIFSKPVTILFAPMTLFFIYRTKIARKQKILTAISYGILALLFGIIIIFNLVINVEQIDQAKKDSPIGYNIAKFWQGFAPLGYVLRFDALFIYFLLPLILGLFIASRKKVKQADAVMFLILGALFSAPVTSFLGPDIFPYRFIPFIVFFSIGVGTLLSKRINNGSHYSPIN